ncbi:uncharacterized protein ATC70_000241 [Mucor velutinosus]|uniref:Galactose oxidase n=1 Tax=Mucor velutinosus TaxID=708070 RepID=A0AAN7DHW5_9FUNG|nr:hypothetical protein ATC70_000241 [Mucor velutinosus]
MMLKHLSLALLLTMNTVYAGQIVRRNAAYCAYLSKRIMCFGGSPNNKGYDTSVNYLDISQTDSTNVTNLENKWDIQVLPIGETSIIREARYDSQYTALADGFKMLIQGGSNELPNKLQRQTVLYDTVNNEWSSLEDYTEPRNGGVRQIFSGTAAYISLTSEIAFYGGRETRVPANYTYVKLDNTTFPKGYTYDATLPYKNTSYESYVGFYYLTIYSVNSNAWRVPPVQPYNILPMQMTATYHEPTQTIYYLGGKRYDPVVRTDVAIPLTWSLTFQMKTLTWDNITLTGVQIPTPRVLHSATLLTGTANTILMYGGSPLSEDDDPVQDYCYTLDIGDCVWTAHSLNAISPNIGPRYYHNAVLVNDTALFILLGKTAANDTTNNVSVLDVRNVSAIQFSDQFPLEEGSSAMATKNDVKQGDSARLSSGAIAGITVGAIAVVIALIIAILLYKRKKQAAKDQHETLDVDWDQIEHQFHEMPPTKREFMTSPTSTLVATITQVPHAVQSQETSNNNILSIFHERPISQTGAVKPDGGREDKSQLP